MRSLVVVSCLVAAGTASAQPGSQKCADAKKAVANEQQLIAAFKLTKNDPMYQGSAETVYLHKLQGMNQQLVALQAGVTFWCSPEAAAALQADLVPKYGVLTIIYAPPGTSGGKGASFVDYASGSSTGTTVSTSASYKSDISVTAGIEVGSSAGFGASVSLGLDWTETNTNKNEVAIKKSDKSEIKVSAPGTDGINHDEDRIYIWLNPKVHLAIKGKSVVQTIGVDGPTMDAIYLYVGWLKNPASMPPDVTARLAARNFTADDYKQLLALDPFASGGTAIDTKRFVQTPTTLPYEPPLQASDGATLQSYTITSDSTTTNTTTGESSNSVDLKITVTMGAAGIAKASLSNEDKWTWTNSNSSAYSTGTSDSATVAVGNPAFGYTGPIDIAVYWDTVYHSFMFAPAVTKPGGTDRGAFITGTITGPDGKPRSGVAVTLTAPGRKLVTYTDARGQYRLFGLASKSAVAGTLVAGGVKKPVSVGAAEQHVDVTVPVMTAVEPVKLPPVVVRPVETRQMEKPVVRKP